MSETRSSTAFDLLRVLLAISGVLALLGGFIGGIATVSVAGARNSASMGTAVAMALGIILMGLLAAALLWTFSAIIGLLANHQDHVEQLQTTQDDVRSILGRVEQSMRTINAARAESAAPRRESAVVATSDNSGRYAAEILDQLRDLEMMDPAQRQRFAARHWARRKEVLTELIERDVLMADWSTAFARLDELQLLLPEDPQVKELRTSAAAEQETRLEEDLRSTRSELQRLMSTAQWQQAEDLAGGLQARYGDKPQATQLLEQVRREHEAYDRENAERLFKEVAGATEKRQWRQAIRNLEEFLARYPQDKRAEALRLDLPTLQENAAAHERKEQEELFKDLLKRQRYDEAIGVARGVLQKYPTSPSAAELTKLLPRVEELARQEAAKAHAQIPVGAN